MARYILARLAFTIPMLLILLTLVFVILRILPGDPCLALLGGRNVTPEGIAQCRELLGLNRPILVQYLDYLGDAARLDFGTSVRTGLPVTQEPLLRGNLYLFLSALHHLVLPSLTLAIVVSGFTGRMTRSSMLEVLDREYVTVARAKGLHERTVITRHALANALIPIVTVVGLQFALLMAGAILTETVYSWPGIARYLLESISSRDFTAIQGAVIFIAFFISAVNLLVDVFYARLDPRIRF